MQDVKDEKPKTERNGDTERENEITCNLQVIEKGC